MLLRPADVSVNNVPSPEVPVALGVDTSELVAKLYKSKKSIAELEPVETITVHRHEELLDEVKQRHADEISV